MAKKEDIKNKKPASVKVEPKATAKKVDVKAAPTKAPIKKVEVKAPVKPVAKKVETKATAKPSAKKVETKATAKPIAKKVEAKATAKPVAKKVETKATAKPVAKKVEAKATAKPVAKKVEAKATAKPVAKKVEAKATAKPAAKKIEKIDTPEMDNESMIDPALAEMEAVKKGKKDPDVLKIEKLVEKAISTKKSKKQDDFEDFDDEVYVPQAPRQKVEGRVIEIGSKKKKTDSEEEVAKAPAPVPEPTPVTAPEPKPAAVFKQAPKKEQEVVFVRITDQRYPDDELEEFGRNIRAQKDEQLEELRMLRERLEDLNSSDMAEQSMIYSMHMAEQGSEAQEKEKTYAQITRITDYVKKLDEALDRIKNKTYGICRVCGCLIAKQRLKAVPITTLSASYKIHQRCPDDGLDKIEALKK